MTPRTRRNRCREALPASEKGSAAVKRLYVDMDGTLVDFGSGIARIDPELRRRYAGHLDDVPGMFALMDPMPGAVEAFEELSGLFDTYILSTAPWGNPSAWADKLAWVQHHLGTGPDSPAYKRLILSHHKDLLMGDYLIDDRTVWGADRFTGQHLHFGTAVFPDWATTVDYLRRQAADG